MITERTLSLSCIIFCRTILSVFYSQMTNNFRHYNWKRCHYFMLSIFKISTVVILNSWYNLPFWARNRYFALRTKMNIMKKSFLILLCLSFSFQVFAQLNLDNFHKKVVKNVCFGTVPEDTLNLSKQYLQIIPATT